MNKFLTATLSVVVLSSLAIGCSKSSDGATGATIPPKLDSDFEHQLATGPKASDQVVNELIARIKRSNSKLPDTKLISGDKISSTTRQRKMANLDSDGLAMLEIMKANCKFEDSGKQENRTGATSKTETQTKNFSGSNCPISETENFSNSIVFSSIDTTKMTISGSMSGSNSGKAEVKNEALREASGIVSTENTGQYSGLFENYSEGSDHQATSGREYMSGALNGAIKLSDSNSRISMSGTFTFLKTTAIRQVQFKITMTLNGEAVVIGYVSNGNGEVDRYYLNGSQISKEQANEFMDTDEMVDEMGGE